MSVSVSLSMSVPVVVEPLFEVWGVAAWLLLLLLVADST